jgi:hypothetical protein
MVFWAHFSRCLSGKFAATAHISKLLRKEGQPPQSSPADGASVAILRNSPPHPSRHLGETVPISAYFAGADESRLRQERGI